MKNLSLILNAILILAVAYLYFLQFGETEVAEDSKAAVVENSSGSNIVYVNSDTLLENYNYYQRIRDELVDKKDSLERVLEYRGRKLEEEVRDYQQKAAGMTPSQRALLEDGLVKKEQRLYQQRETILTQLAQEESDLTDELHSKLYGYLSDYNQKHGYDFILGFQRGSGILHANDSLDITVEILEGLNASQQ